MLDLLRRLLDKLTARAQVADEHCAACPECGSYETVRIGEGGAAGEAQWACRRCGAEFLASSGDCAAR